MPGPAGCAARPERVHCPLMHVEFHGAADGVTGSLHRVRVGSIDIALECGLFQGRRAESNRRNRELPDWARSASAVVLSHAHLDHSGNLPTLVARGYQGHIFCTPATRDLCSVMLRDSATLQEQDAKYINRRNREAAIPDRVEPIYTVEDAQKAVSRMIGLPLYRKLPIAPGVELTFHDAGHVLGSGLVVLDLEERGVRRRLLFTGDLGRAALPLLSDPDRIDGVDALLMESTYGDRTHPPIEDLESRLEHIVADTIARGGKVLIPSFALERAQEVLFTLERLSESGRLPDVPIYIDSPLAIAITEIYKLHPDELDDDVRARILDRNDPFTPPRLSYVSEASDSKKLVASDDPCIVIAGSGMCEGGRIVYHLQRGLENEKNSVVIVGFMAAHTLGRRLTEHRSEVKVLGLEHPVRAEVHSLLGLSAHADRDGLIAFARDIAERGNLRAIGLVHGEDRAREELAAGLTEAGLPKPIIARPGDTMPL